MVDRPAWADVDLSAVVSNAAYLKSLAPRGARLCAVVKADGYGHGAAAVSHAALAGGADSLAVAFAEEGIELRRQGITAPVLVLGFTGHEGARRAAGWGLDVTVVSADNAKVVAEAAAALGRKVRVHLKVDTGMSRLGVFPEDALSVALEIARMPSLELEGVFSHFAASDSLDLSFALDQLAIFQSVLERMARSGLRVPVRHIANSAALLFLPEASLDMVRPGISLYGLRASAERDSLSGLLPAMALRARVVQTRTVPEGTTVSYGRTFRASRPTRLAVLPLGYADGVSRALSNRGSVGFAQGRAPIAGRVCMDQCMVDITGLPSVREGDVATFFGPGGPSVGEVADLLGTIDYEITCAVSQRVPRIYAGQPRPPLPSGV
ncbi:MAG TPA: alanine racemase [Magnetospirillaceae bacterium]|nr:alanine racemase [Magnetospirillaceae bacterium]